MTWCPKCSGEVVFESPTAEYGRCSCGLSFGRAGLERVERRNEVDAKIRELGNDHRLGDLLRVSMFDTEEKAERALQQLAPLVFGKPRAAKIAPLLELMRPHMLEPVQKKADVLISVLLKK